MSNDVPYIEECLLRPSTFETLKTSTRSQYYYIRCDTHERCNLFCSYCYHSEHRKAYGNSLPQRKIELADFTRFLVENVEWVERFQLGCGYEPMLDDRLAEFLSAVHTYARPRQDFSIITNGTLLHRFSPELLQQYGVSTLIISIDTVDPALHQSQRGGSLPKVLRSLQEYRAALPELTINFSTVVTNDSIATIESLVEYAISLRVKNINFRQVNLDTVDDFFTPKVRRLSAVTIERFLEMYESLKPFSDRIELQFETTTRQFLQHKSYETTLAGVGSLPTA